MPSRAASVFTPTAIVVLSSYILLESTVVLLIAGSKTEDNRPPYNTATIVLVVEFLKLVSSVVGLWNAGRAGAHIGSGDGGLAELRRVTVASLAPYAVPALLYAFNNNLFLKVLTMVNPSAFQLMLGTRAVLTGIVLRVLLNRKLSRPQWFSAVVLCIGAALAQVSSKDSSSSDSATDADEAISTATFVNGLALTVLYCLVSVTASVYNEKLLKNEPSIHLANIQLYFFGVVTNLVGLMWQAGGTEGFWRGWDLASTWSICSIQVVVGLLVSRVMRQFDSIVKIFCVACSNLVVYLSSVFLMRESFTFSFLVAFVLVTGSGYVYTTSAPAQTETTLPISSKLKASPSPGVELQQNRPN